MGGLGVFFANVLFIALQVVALFLGHFVSSFSAGFGYFLGVLGAGLVLGFQFRLGDVFLALGFLLADVLGVVLQGVTGFLVGLIGGRDGVLGGLVLGRRHGESGRCQQTSSDGSDQSACEFHGFLLGVN
ncbi:hypothetical protein D3C87_1508680 [compost metagenome]